jgi:hypothetical protein
MIFVALVLCLIAEVVIYYTKPNLPPLIVTLLNAATVIFAILALFIIVLPYIPKI